MFDSIIDYFKEVIEQIRERVRNPFIEKTTTPFAGAFFLALLFYNWPLFFSVFSFDTKETRLSKIEIIKGYLVQESVLSRIWHPVLFAFISIFFFYIFSNLSLGITTVFNRWFKAIVLYFTDRGSITTKEEYEKMSNRASSFKQSLDRVKIDLANSEDSRNTLDAQLTNLTVRYNDVSAENQKLKTEIATRTQVSTAGSEAQFQILYARYGRDQTYNDVTAIVDNLITSNGKMTVNNTSLEGDPMSYAIKTLFVVYQSQKNRYTLSAIEGEVLELTDGRLTPHATDVSRRKRLHLDNEKKLSTIINGLWELTFIKDGEKDTEPIFIDESGKYFAHAAPGFFLRTISINQTEKQISFNKVTLDGKLHSKETLSYQDDNLITGSDSLGYSLEYRRVAEVSFKFIQASAQIQTQAQVFMAKPPAAASINPSFLGLPTGSFSIWAFVTDIHNKLSDKPRTMYIAGYATNGGNKMNNPAAARYPNRWAIVRQIPTSDNPQGAWQFWCNNTTLEYTFIEHKAILTGGWHLFSICWSSKDNYIKFIIDDSVVGETQFNNWPTDLSESVLLGTWPQKSDLQYFDSKIGHWQIGTEGYQEHAVKDLSKKKPRE